MFTFDLRILVNDLEFELKVRGQFDVLDFDLALNTYLYIIKLYDFVQKVTSHMTLKNQTGNELVYTRSVFCTYFMLKYIQQYIFKQGVN